MDIEKVGLQMKKNLGARNLLYPMPTVIVGAMVDGKPNFTTVAHVGILNSSTPFLLSISMGKMHHSTRGIKETGQFSINIPSVEMMEEVDLAGIVSGRHGDKSIHFDHFFGELEAAPLIHSCPANMECTVRDTMELQTHTVFAGEITCSHAEEEVLDLEGTVVDLARSRPLLFDMGARRYWSIGEPVGQCWSSGKSLLRKKRL